MHHHRMLATHGDDTVASTVADMLNFDPMSRSSYLASVSDGSVIIYGETAHFDTTNVTVLEPRANISDACVYLSTFQATRGVTYMVMCTDGRKVEIRLKSQEEERALQRALEIFDRAVHTRSSSEP
jgi:hypothetical protein